MKNICISDVTMKTSANLSLSFREKLELCKLLDRLGVSYIETGALKNLKTDGLLIKSLSSLVNNSGLTVRVPMEDEEIEYVWNCLDEAEKARLQVSLPVSAVQMEYLCHKKPDAMLKLIGEKVSFCKKLCGDVEFSAEDAGRADSDFLISAVKTAAEAGASTVTLCDTAGIMLPDEFFEFVKGIRSALPENVELGVEISNNSFMANSCALYAVKAGADEVKVSAFGDEGVALRKFATVIKNRGDSLGIACGVRTTELDRAVGQIERLCSAERSKSSPFDSGVRSDEDFSLNVHDDSASVIKAAQRLGYDLSDEDAQKVCEALKSLSEHKNEVSAKELDVLIATNANQVPATYKLESYVINSGNLMTATSRVTLVNGERKDGLCIGDGPIDASFLAIEQITGTHYELDDFRIRAVTEGREAMGEAIVRLRSNGKLYSGHGISTDIVGSSIMAYINALNKIVYEENEQ